MGDGCRALTHVVLGDIEEGEAQAQALLANSLLRSRGFSYQALLEAQSMQGSWDLVAETLERAIPHQGGSATLRTAVDRVAGTHWLVLGDRARATDHLRRSLATAERHGMGFAAAQARHALAGAVDGPEAEELVAAANATFRQLRVALPGRMTA